MNRENIIRMARESGAMPYTNRHYPDRPTHTFMPEQLERFAALVAAAEREACAKVCDVEASVNVTNASEQYQEGRSMGAAVCAAAIRARGNT